jgi:hypothetical protein
VTAPRKGPRHFGLPFGELVVAYGWSTLFLVLGVLVLLADRDQLAPGLARLVRGNPEALGPRAFASLLLVSGVGTALRARLSGVVVDDERLVVRTSVFLGLPRVRMAYWAELRSAIIQGGRVELVQFDGSSFVLPPTDDAAACEAAVRERLGHFYISISNAHAED